MPLFLQQCSDCKCNILHHPATPSWNHQLTTKLGLALSGAMELGEPLPAMYTMWEIQISSKLGGLPDFLFTAEVNGATMPDTFLLALIVGDTLKPRCGN